VVTRRTIFELRKARGRAHILEGLAVALANIDEVIDLIKGSASPMEAKAGLMDRVWRPGDIAAMLEKAGAGQSRPDNLDAGLGLGPDGYRLSETQAQAILDLRLHRLTGLEQGKIFQEYLEILDAIANLLEILSSPDQLMRVIQRELVAIRDQFGDNRRTEILTDHADLTLEDLITPEDRVVTLSHAGYAKAQPLSQYQAQKRGGKGRTAAATKDEDFIDKLFVAHSHDTVLCFSSLGKVYWLKVYELPQAGPAARGRPMVNLLPLGEGERINAVLPVTDYDEGRFVFMATSTGTVKKTPLVEFSRPLAKGIIAMDLHEGEHLVDVAITDGERDIMLFSSAGKAVRFREAEVRPMGRGAHGVRGIQLGESQRVIAMLVVESGCDVLCATENGFGKRTPVDEFATKGRGTMGVIAIDTSVRNGSQVGAVLVRPEDEIMLITVGGTLVRTPVAEIRVVGRSAMGVKLIQIGEGERLAGLERILAIELNAEDDVQQAADPEQ